MKRAANPRAAIDGKAWGLDSAEIKARVVDLSGFFSGHADHAGLLDYIFDKQGTQPYRPLKWVFLVHGDDNARTELCRAIEKLKRQNSSARRIIERVELPSPAGPWFDLVREKWVWEFHPKVRARGTSCQQWLWPSGEIGEDGAILLCKGSECHQPR